MRAAVSHDVRAVAGGAPWSRRPMRAARTGLAALGVMLATAGVSRARGDAKVTSATPTTAYIDAGAADGLAAGTSWQVTVDGRALSLHVAAVASHDAVLEVTGGPPPAIGAVVQLPPGLTPPAPATARPPPPPTPPWQDRAADPALAAVRAAAAGTQPAPPGATEPGVRVHGEVSASAFVAADLENTSTSWQDLALASQLTVEAGAWRYNHLLEARLSGSPELFFAPLQHAKARFDVYLMRLAYTPAGARLAAAIGRQPGAPLGEFGGVDGGRARMVLGGGADVTVFAGLRPASDLALSLAPRAGADLGWTLAGRDDLRARADVGFAADAWHGALDRALAAASLDLAGARWYARGDATVDLATDAAAKSGARLTRAAGYARTRRGAVTAAVQVAYDRPFVNRALAEELALVPLDAYGPRTFAGVDLTYALRGGLDVGLAATGSRGDGFTSGFLEAPLSWTSSTSALRATLAPHVILGSLVSEAGARGAFELSAWGWSVDLGGSFNRVSAGGVQAWSGIGRATLGRPFLRRWRTSLSVQVAAGDGPPARSCSPSSATASAGSRRRLWAFATPRRTLSRNPAA